MINATAVILAGGKSSRMGENKALIKVKTMVMIEEAVQKVKPYFSEVLISANSILYRDLGVRIVGDIYHGCGPLGGIHASLKASKSGLNFFAACDMPFFNPRLASYMVSIVSDYDAVVPRVNDKYQPLFAVYSKTCLTAIEKSIKERNYKITSFYSRIKVRFMEEDELLKFGDPETMFFNVNTPDDLNRAFVIAETGRIDHGKEV